METIEIKSMTSIEDAVKLVLHTAKLSGSRVVAEFNGFILDSKNSYDKNLDLYWAYMGRADRNVNWEQRRYEIAKEMLPIIYRIECGDFSIERMAVFAVMYADILIKELKKKETDNENN
jgi:hypothetical protein